MDDLATPIPIKVFHNLNNNETVISYNKILRNKALTDLETSYIKKYPFDNLYNFIRTATSLEGYKHTDEAKLKMLKRFENKSNHPMYGKTHKEETLKFISKPGELNPMFVAKHQQHSEETKKNISDRISKHPNGVGICFADDLNNNLIKNFKKNIELVPCLVSQASNKHLNISKVTVVACVCEMLNFVSKSHGIKYLNSNLVYKNQYRFKVNNN